MQELVESIPFNRLVGVRLKRLHRDGVTVECVVRAELLNASGVLHGGVTAMLADVAVGVALARHLGKARAATTVELKINYLRPVHAGGTLRARSRLLKVGKALCVARVDLSDAGLHAVGSALVTYMLLNQ